MKILHIYKDYAPITGGIENHIRTLAELQAACGHQVVVLVTNPGGQPDRETIRGVEVHRLPRLVTLASTPLSFAFPTAIRRQSPEICHLHFPYPFGELSYWVAARRIPAVLTYHSDVVRQQALLRVYAPLLRRILMGIDRIIPTSPPYLESSVFLRPLIDQCTVVPLCVDPTPFENPTPLFPSEEIPTILFVGRHRYYKGVDTLIRAMERLEARLLIAGDGPMRRTWERLVQDLQLTGRIRFLGHVPDPDLPGLYASADVFVLPANARAEAFGKVLLEAMAAGIPCVTTELGTGTSFIVQNEITGLVVPPSDARKLGKAIQTLIDDPALRAKMGESGRRRAREFSPDRMAAQIEQVYQSVLSG